ncbi:MAG TPA: 4Fe-4S dicluster domain-containing protein [Phycisphaerae bacterium]|nr:4Fe-4S dicluster domain-containing protein [Phycisphaerae bacterium]
MGLLGRYRGCFGGMHLPDGKAETLRRPIRDLPTPPRLRVPLAQSLEAPAVARVRTGDQVTAGQVIADPSGKGAVPIHAPVDATVGGFTTVDTPWSEEVPAVELQPTAKAPAPVPDAPIQLPTCNLAELLETASAAGIELQDGPQTTPQSHVEWIIVNALESEPLQTANLRSLIERPDEVISTAGWLHRTARAEHVTLVVDRRRRVLAGESASLRRATRGTAVRVVGLPDKYPQSFPMLLARSITGREVPYRQSPMDVGVWVIDVCDLLAILRAVGAGRPHTHEIVTVTGDAVERPGNYRMPLGVAVADVARHVGVHATAARVIAGSLLSGPAIRHLQTVLTNRLRALVFTRVPTPASRPPLGCIRCGLCVDHCPVGIDPRALLDLVERRRFDRVARRYPAACLDCGLCSYVCPSYLPVMRAVQRSRRHVLDA